MMQIGAEKSYFLLEEKMKEPIPSGKEIEIDMIEEAGILVTVKANLDLAAVGLSSGSSRCPNGEMKPCGSSRSRVIRLTNAVSKYEIKHDFDHEAAMNSFERVGVWCGRFKKVVIPRPNPDRNLTQPGVGKAFVEFQELDGASRFKAFMHGKPYWGKHVVAEYYPEDKYAQGDLDLVLLGG